MNEIREHHVAPIQLSQHANAVLLTLMYFDVFRHPLTIDEVFRFCQWEACTLTEVASSIEELQTIGMVKGRDGFFFLSDAEHFIDLRHERNHRAIKYSRKAEKWSQFISRFPFVRTVCISGSLSKGTMDKDGDIDYFIITEPGRLWVARTLLILFKKVFLLNSKKYFCVNYFIDTGHLSIPDRNLFAATEITFLKPMRDSSAFRHFIEENRWSALFYPNHNRKAENIPPTHNGMLKRYSENLLSGKLGEWLDEKFFRITLSRWKNKFPHHDESHFEIDFRSRKHVSKHHPNGFQRVVLSKLEAKRLELQEKYSVIILPHVMEWTSCSDE